MFDIKKNLNRNGWSVGEITINSAEKSGFQLQQRWAARKEQMARQPELKNFEGK